MKPFIKKYLPSLLVTTVILAIGVLLTSNNILSTWHDRLATFLYPTSNTHTDLVTIVAIDSKSLTPIAEGGLGRWQEWDRQYFAQVIENLNTAGAQVIGVDVFFANPGNEGLKKELETLKMIYSELDLSLDDIETYTQFGDESLALALENKNNVILAASLGTESEPAVLPLTTLAKHAHIASVDLTEDSNNYIRKAPTLLEQHQNIPAGFALASALSYLGVPHSELSQKNSHLIVLPFTQKDPQTGLNFGPIKLPIDKDGNFYVNFKGTPFTTPTLSFADVYHNNFDPALVKNKIILIGEMDAGLHDDVYTPVSYGQPMPGVELHANAIETILTNSAPQDLSSSMTYGLLILLGIVLASAFIFFQPLYGLIILLIFIPLYFYTSILVFAQTLTFLPLIHIPLTAVLLYGGITLTKFAFTDKERKQALHAFSRYLSPEVVHKVMKHPEMLALGGKKRNCTVAFTDIAGFTTLSETVEPEVLVNFLHDYLHEMTLIIMGQEGTLDKYIGDAIMYFWGAPLLQEDHAVKACGAILAMHKKAATLFAKYNGQKGFDNMHIRTGIAAGDMIIGNFGSHERFDYTAIGDTVNLAARLEGANKTYGTLISANQEVYQKAKDTFLFRPLDLIKVKGKNKPVQFYELINSHETSTHGEQKLAEHFSNAFELYQAREFQNAKEIFESLSTDPVSKLYVERCTQYIKTPPAPDWDGSYTMKTK